MVDFCFHGLMESTEDFRIRWRWRLKRRDDVRFGTDRDFELQRVVHVLVLCQFTLFCSTPPNDIVSFHIHTRRVILDDYFYAPLTEVFFSLYQLNRFFRPKSFQVDYPFFLFKGTSYPARISEVSRRIF